MDHLLKNEGLLTNALEMIEKNPEMLKNLLGDKMPAGFLDNPKNVQWMVFFIKYLLKLVFFMKRVYQYR